MGKTGEAKTGESPTGDVAVQTIAAPVTTLTLSTPEPTVTGAGSTSVAAPVTLLTLSTPSPSFVRQLSMPVTTLTLSTPEPEVTGAGSTSIAAPVTTLTLSTPSPAIGVPFWQVDNAALGPLVDETRTWQTLSLTVEVDDTTYSNDVEPLKDTANKLSVVTKSDGSFSTLDRASTNGVYTLTPPVGRDPPRDKRDYLIGAYSKRQVDQAAVEHEVSLDLVAKSNRDPDGAATDQTRASDEWSFAFRAATIATKRVQHDFGEGSDTNVDTVELQLLLDATQTKILEESVTRIAAVSVREVPDGANTVDDDSASPTSANTVTVTTPDNESPIADGDYVVLDWQTTYLNNGGYRTTLTLAKT